MCVSTEKFFFLWQRSDFFLGRFLVGSRPWACGGVGHKHIHHHHHHRGRGPAPSDSRNIPSTPPPQIKSHRHQKNSSSPDKSDRQWEKGHFQKKRRAKKSITNCACARIKIQSLWLEKKKESTYGRGAKGRDRPNSPFGWCWNGKTFVQRQSFRVGKKKRDTKKHIILHIGNRGSGDGHTP